MKHFTYCLRTTIESTPLTRFIERKKVDLQFTVLSLKHPLTFWFYVDDICRLTPAIPFFEFEDRAYRVEFNKIQREHGNLL